MKILLEKQNSKCPICKNMDFDIALKKDRYNFKINTSICKKCWLVMTNPLLDKWFLNDFYKNHYRRYYESVAVPNSNYFLKLVWRAARRIKYISKYLRNWIKYLDIWSAEWSYLWLVKQFYEIEETWIEPNKKYSEYSIKKKDLNVINDIYENIKLKDNYFDIISHFHVLEHIYDINHFIKFNFDKLKNWWILYIEVPNIKWNWSGIWMFHIAHLYNFSKISISNLLIKNGFILEDIQEYEDEVFWSILRLIAKKSEKKDNSIEKENHNQIKNHILKNVNKISRLEYILLNLSKKIIWIENTKKITQKIKKYVKRK